MIKTTIEGVILGAKKIAGNKNAQKAVKVLAAESIKKGSKAVSDKIQREKALKAEISRLKNLLEGKEQLIKELADELAIEKAKKQPLSAKELIFGRKKV